MLSHAQKFRSSGVLEIWKSRNLEIWRILEFRNSGILEFQNSGVNLLCNSFAPEHRCTSAIQHL